jgi:hypothetical protein
MTLLAIALNVPADLMEFLPPLSLIEYQLCDVALDRTEGLINLVRNRGRQFTRNG